MSAIIVHHFCFLFICLFLWDTFGMMNAWANDNRSSNPPPLPLKNPKVCEDYCGIQIKCSEPCWNKCYELCSQKECEKEKGDDCEKEKQSKKNSG